MPKIPRPVLYLFIAFILVWIFVANWGSGNFIRVIKFLDEHEGAVVGLGTFALAGVTLLLYSVGKDTAKKQLRAYVGIRPHKDYPPIFLDQLHSHGIKFQIVNYGQTPAIKVRHEIAIGAFHEESDLTDMEFAQEGSNFVLHPDATSDLGATRKRTFSPRVIREIEEGAIKLFVWGEIRYQDIYGVERVTKFRFILSHKALVWTNKGNEAT